MSDKKDDNSHSSSLLEGPKANGLVLTKEDLQRSKEQQRQTQLRKEEADARKLLLEAKAQKVKAQRMMYGMDFASERDASMYMAHFPPPTLRHELLRDMQVFEGHPSMDEVERFRLIQIRVPAEVPAAVPLSAKAIAMDERIPNKVIWVGPGDYRHPYYRHHRR